MEQQRERECGKALFSAGDFRAAQLHFTAALRHCLTHSLAQHSDRVSDRVSDSEFAAACLSNRAVCHLKLSEWSDAASDAAAAVTLALTHSSAPLCASESTSETTSESTSTAHSLTKPLYLLSKAVYQQAMQCTSEAVALTHYQQSLTVLKFLQLTDPTNTHAHALAAVVTKKMPHSLTHSHTRSVSSEGVSECGEARAPLVSPGRHTVTCAFEGVQCAPAPR
jgi:hypothetical protein